MRSYAKRSSCRRSATSPSSDDLIPARLVGCLDPAWDDDGGVIERTDGAFRCTRSGRVSPDRDGIPSLLVESAGNGSDPVTDKVKAFYEEHPFPNYDGVQDFSDLVNRGMQNQFAKGLLDAIGYNKLILECGCGTGQLSHFLSLNNNHVLGIDLSLSSLKLAVEHKLRNSVARVGFVEMKF